MWALSRQFLISFIVPVVGIAGGAVLNDREGPVVWVWSGAVTSESAVVKAKVARGTKEVQLRVSRGLESEDPLIVPGTPDDHGVAAFELEALEQDTSYHYTVAVDGQPSLGGHFHTFSDGPMSFRIAFASCASTGSNHPVFAVIQNLHPILFIHMGDFHYEDIRVNDPAQYRRAFDRCLTSPRQGSLYRHVPIAYVWDDHDFGPDNSDRTAPGKPAALMTYQEYVPHYPLVTWNGGLRTIQQAFTVGRVRFIMTDLRAERSPAGELDGPNKTMLGKPQRNWLFQQFSGAGHRYPLVIWVNVNPWITKSSPGSDQGWEPYSWERTRIADHIKELGLVKKLLILSGDGHMIAIDDGSNSNYASTQSPGEPAFPLMQAAPLDRFPRVKGGPYSHGTYVKKRLFGILKQQQFGLMDVKDDGSTLKVILSGRDSRGRLLDGMSLTLSCAKETCRPE